VRDFTMLKPERDAFVGHLEELRKVKVPQDATALAVVRVKSPQKHTDTSHVALAVVLAKGCT